MRPLNLPLIALGALALAACGNQTPPAASTDAGVSADDVAAKRAELEQLEAQLAEQQQPAPAPAPAAPAPAPAPKPATSTASSKPATSTAKPAQPAASQNVTVPAGTELPVALIGALSSKSAKEGQTVQARVLSNVTVDGRTVIPAGITVAGSVVKVVSGSNKVGGTPTLLLGFDRIELANGKDVPITGTFETKGKSDNVRDAAKIAGGAAAGALLADQVSKKDRNKVIGGIIGAAAGAVAAKETGTEVTIADGTEFTLVLSEAVEIPRS